MSTETPAPNTEKPEFPPLDLDKLYADLASAIEDGGSPCINLPHLFRALIQQPGMQEMIQQAGGDAGRVKSGLIDLIQKTDEEFEKVLKASRESSTQTVEEDEKGIVISENNSDDDPDEFNPEGKKPFRVATNLTYKDHKIRVGVLRCTYPGSGQPMLMSLSEPLEHYTKAAETPEQGDKPLTAMGCLNMLCQMAQEVGRTDLCIPILNCGIFQRLHNDQEVESVYRINAHPKMVEFATQAFARDAAIFLENPDNHPAMAAALKQILPEVLKDDGVRAELVGLMREALTPQSPEQSGPRSHRFFARPPQTNGEADGVGTGTR